MELLNYFLNNIFIFVLLFILIIIFFSVKDNDILYHKKIFKNYCKAKYSVKKTRYKLIALNLCMITLIIIFYKTNIEYIAFYTIISILVTALVSLLSIINSKDVRSYYDNLDKKNSALKNYRFSETNSIAIMTLFMGGIILTLMLLLQMSGFEKDYNITKAILLLVLLFIENFMIIIRKFVTIYVNFLDR